MVVNSFVVMIICTAVTLPIPSTEVTMANKRFNSGSDAITSWMALLVFSMSLSNARTEALDNFSI